MDSIIQLTPVFKNKIWGGRKLESEFGYTIPDGPVGECWAISAHPEGDCTIAWGTYKGKTLSWLWDNHREFFGNVEGDRFPLLVKIIDAADDLSIQVHPGDAYAAEHENGSLGKKECWYVLDAEPNEQIVIGQHAKTREEFARMVQASQWDELLNLIPLKQDDFFQINWGTVHAIKGGTVVLETQQSSDITYRVYDYDRRQDDGTLRELHLQQALDVVDYSAKAPVSGTLPAQTDLVQTLESNDCYTVQRVRTAKVSTTKPVELPLNHPFTCVSVTKGTGTINGLPLKRGAHLLACSTCEKLELIGDMELIISFTA